MQKKVPNTEVRLDLRGKEAFIAKANSIIILLNLLRDLLLSRIACILEALCRFNRSNPVKIYIDAPNDQWPKLEFKPCLTLDPVTDYS